MTRGVMIRALWKIFRSTGALAWNLYFDEVLEKFLEGKHGEFEIWTC